VLRKRRYDLVAFDVDGTLVDDTVFVWKTLHDYFGTDPAEQTLGFDNYMQGRWSYAEWFQNDLRLLALGGATHQTMLRAISGMRLMPGVHETLAELRSAGAVLLILSGSLDIVTRKFGLDGLFDEVYLNRLEFDPEGRLAKGVATPYDVWDKARGLRDVSRRRGIPMGRTAFVGDNFNDVAVAKEAGFSIAFNCKSDELAREADVVLPGGDMRAVLPYLLES
jgi:phosphoserine phosphatase